MDKIGICGYFADDVKDYGGQPVKTKIFTEELTNIFGENMVEKVDTINWKRNPFNLIMKCFNLSRNCKNIIILPAANGIKIFAPIFLLFNKIFNSKLHYVVIGAWLPNLLIKNKKLAKQLMQFDGIYVETHTMEKKLIELEFNNVYYMPNLKRLTPVDLSSIHYNKDENPKFRFCTFSRVVKEKGIGDAINAIIEINQVYGEPICSLDIYGHIYAGYKEEFKSILEQAPDYIVYKGIVNPEESVHALKNYYMQLFPTMYRTEGVPGSVIDSYFAGLPVLASKWESYDDVIHEGKTGIGFEFGNYNDLLKKLEWTISNSEEVFKMKNECILKANEYTPERVLGEFRKYLT